MSRILYRTGRTPQGIPLLGGVWRLWHQDGFPLEMSYLFCQAEGLAIDWLEAMADASLTDNLPALMEAVEAFLPADVIQDLKLGFAGCLSMGKTPQMIVEEKRQGAPSP